MITISIEDVLEAFETRCKINRIPLAEIIWTRRGKPIEIDPKEIDEWKFIGMLNTDFVSMILRERYED